MAHHMSKCCFSFKPCQHGIKGGSYDIVLSSCHVKMTESHKYFVFCYSVFIASPIVQTPNDISTSKFGLTLMSKRTPASSGSQYQYNIFNALAFIMALKLVLWLMHHTVSLPSKLSGPWESIWEPGTPFHFVFTDNLTRLTRHQMKSTIFSQNLLCSTSSAVQVHIQLLEPASSRHHPSRKLYPG